MRLIAPFTCLLLAACGQGQNDPGPGAVTVGEARALDDAAEMLEERRLSDEDLPKPSGPDSAPPNSDNAAGAQGDAGR